MRRLISITEAIVSANARLRRIIKIRGHFLSARIANWLINDPAIRPALEYIIARWTRSAREWTSARKPLAIVSGNRLLGTLE